jgi:hypothetical protein
VDVYAEYPTASGTFTGSAAFFDYSTGGAINENPDPSLPINTELEGYYVKAGYLLPDPVGMGRLQLFARHENRDYVSFGESYDNTVNSIGANYYIDGQKLKFTLEYADMDFDADDSPYNSLKDQKQLTLGFQFIF